MKIAASILAGIPVEKYKIMGYVFSGLLASIAAIVVVGRFDAIQATFG